MGTNDEEEGKGEVDEIEALQQEHLKKCMTWKLDVGVIHLNFNPLVTFASAVIVWGFVAWCIIDPEGSLEKLATCRDWITDKWTWLYVGTQDCWAFFIIMLYFSKYSNMRLGRDDEKPEFSNGAYFTMLFAAGIGIGLFYYSVAEPIFHYEPGAWGNRYWGRYNDNQRAQDAMNLTFFHWGIHGWIVYVLIGLLLGFLCYRKGLPMTMRTCFYPLLGEKVFGIIGDLIDILCVICTMFGVCTSLGLGVIQLNTGINRFNSSIEISTDNQIISIWLITAVATVSVISGIKVGIKHLSAVCFGIGCLIMFIVFFADKTWFILNLYVQSIGYYFQWVVQLGFHTDAFAQLNNAPDGKEKHDWIDAWTIFYWGWWISWSPFVGMFIAKISRGRTIRDFITYTMTIPILYSFIWMAIFGGAGIDMERRAQNLGVTCDMYKLPAGNTIIINATNMTSLNMTSLNITSVNMTSINTTNLPPLTEILPYSGNLTKRILADGVWEKYGLHRLSCRASSDMFFDVIEQYGDLGNFLSVLSLIGLILYFVTSSDSGSLVIDCLSANGHPDPPILQRIFWALTEGATATALLKAGGPKALTALQTASVAAGLPCTFLLNFACVAMWKAVQVEAGEIDYETGKWRICVWDAFSSVERFLGVLINLVAPWYNLGKIDNEMQKKPSTRHRVIASLLYAILFYLWIALMIAELAVSHISYVGWAILVAMFVYAGGLRGSIREKFDLSGDMLEDFFIVMLVYPLAIVQMREQVSFEQERLKQTGENPPAYSDVEMHERGTNGDVHIQNEHANDDRV